MEENEHISSEIYNVTKDTVTVKTVGDICKKYNPKVQLKETNDEIPNLGFSLSNQKILKTGFKFLYSLEKNIAEMIFKWSKHNMIMDLEYVRNSQNDYLDKRGQINNFELTEPINLMGLIYSKKVR